MSLLGTLAEVLVPVYLVVAVGYLVGRFGRLDGRPLASLAYWVLGPAFIFDVLASAEIDADVVGRVVTAAAGTMAVVGALAAVIGRLTGVGYERTAASVLTSIHGNVGNFGLAICAFAFGPESLPVASIVLVTVNTVGIVVGVGSASYRQGSALRAILAGVASPLALAVIPALAVNAAGFTVPLWVDRPVGLLAAALIPVMLLTLGIQLAGMEGRRPAPTVAVPIALKLVVAPLVAAALVGAIGPSGQAGWVVILQSAMPAAVFTSLIAIEHDLEADHVTAIVLVGTLVSVVTLPIVLVALGV